MSKNSHKNDGFNQKYLSLRRPCGV